MLVDKESEQVEPNTRQLTTGYARYFVLGIPNALLTFSLSLTGIIFTDLTVYRTCLTSLETYNQTQCLMLHTDPASPEAQRLEAEIEPAASMILMTKSLIESILPAVISLFIGPWSDRGGRRPVLLAAFTGIIVMFATLSLICNWNISPWYLLLPSIPAFIVGGSCTIGLASNCHISDTTVNKDRTVLLAWLQTSMFVGVTLGVVVGPLIFKNYGYTTVFSVATMCSTLALLHTYFFVPESVKNISKNSLQGLFKISFLKEIVTSSLLKRDGLNRPVVWLGLFIFTLCEMLNKGDMTIGFLFTRTRLGWDVQQFSYFAGAGLLLTVTGLAAASLLSPILGISDTMLAGIGLISLMSSAGIKSLTIESWHLYTATVLTMFSGVMGPAVRSIISKNVPAEDVGKVFSLIGLLETLCPIAGAPLLTLIYSRYLPPVYPSPVYLFASSCFAVAIICLVCVHILLKRTRKLQSYTPTVQEEDTKL